MTHRSLCLALCLVLLACSRPSATTVDLLSLPATSPVAMGEVDFGTPAGQQCSRQGLSAKPGTMPKPGGLKAWKTPVEVLFTLLLPTEVAVKGRLGYAGSTIQKVEVRCNGQAIGQVDIVPGNSEFQLLVPEQVVRPGINLLSLEIPSQAVPLILWKAVSFTATAQTARVEGDRLVIPRGSRSDFYFRAPLNGEFHADADMEATPDQLGLELEIGGLDGITRHDASQSGHITFEFPEGARDRLCRLTVIGGDSEISLGSPQVTGLEGTSPSPSPVAAQDPPPPLILLICVDTLRADATGGAHSATPLLDKRRFQSFSMARAQSGWTKTAIASVFTGREVLRHGVLLFRDKLSEDMLTLSETLRSGGYRTLGASANDWVVERLGFGQGFEQFKTLKPWASPGVDWALARLKEHDRQQPLFLYLHLLDPHDPYSPPAEFRPQTAVLQDASEKTIIGVWSRLVRGEQVTSELSDLRAFYRGEVRYVDKELERLFVYLESEGLYDPALIVVFSDHGEEFGEHRDLRHNNSLYQSLLSVPLKMKLPAGSKVTLPLDSEVQHIDIMPTLLAFAKCSPLEPLDGVDLTTTTPGDLRRRVALGYMETGKDADVVGLKPWSRQYESAISDGFKLMIRRADTVYPYKPAWEFFDLRSDPKEQKDLAGNGGPEMGYLWAQLVAARARAMKAPDASDAVTRDVFRALPYLR